MTFFIAKISIYLWHLDKVLEFADILNFRTDAISRIGGTEDNHVTLLSDLDINTTQCHSPFQRLQFTCLLPLRVLFIYIGC